MNHSPEFILPPINLSDLQYDFYEALKAVADGKKITKLEWADSNAFGMMKDGILMIHKQGLVPGGLPGVGFGFSYHAWTISADDMAGTDWVIVE
jgi:hypothetical protein